MFIKTQFFPLDLCQLYHTHISDYYRFQCLQNQDPLSFNESRRLPISDIDHSNVFVKDFLQKEFHINLRVFESELVAWPKFSKSKLHVHNYNQKDDTGLTAIVYLNDDYSGGEFYTGNKWEIRPSAGMIIFFDGQKIPHGVKEITDGTRYTLINWYYRD